MANRMSRLFGEDGNCFYLARDHGYFQGPTHGLEKPVAARAGLDGIVDAIFIPRGSLRVAIGPLLKSAVIPRVSGGNSILAEDLANEDLTVSVEEMLRLNLTAVRYSVYIGSKYEHRTLMGMNTLVNLCAPFGIPVMTVMAVTAVGRELKEKQEFALFGNGLPSLCRSRCSNGEDLLYKGS